MEFVNSILTAVFGSPKEQPDKPKDKQGVAKGLASLLRSMKGKP